MIERHVMRSLGDLVRALGELLAPEPAPELRPIPVRTDPYPARRR